MRLALLMFLAGGGVAEAGEKAERSRVEEEITRLLPPGWRWVRERLPSGVIGAAHGPAGKGSAASVVVARLLPATAAEWSAFEPSLLGAGLSLLERRAIGALGGPELLLARDDGTIIRHLVVIDRPGGPYLVTIVSPKPQSAELLTLVRKAAERSRELEPSTAAK